MGLDIVRLTQEAMEEILVNGSITQSIDQGGAIIHRVIHDGINKIVVSPCMTEAFVVVETASKIVV